MPPVVPPSLALLRLGSASLLVLAACASVPLAPPPAPPPPSLSTPVPVASTPAPPPPAPATPADAEVTRWSHDAVAALDRGDATALGAVLSAGFLRHEGGAPRSRDEVLAEVAKRPPGLPAVAERTWQHERARPSSARETTAASARCLRERAKRSRTRHPRAACS
ncbi:MAG TPA: hypothetical protein VIY73_05360 [Polyangiaceae bacterium]